MITSDNTVTHQDFLYVWAIGHCCHTVAIITDASQGYEGTAWTLLIDWNETQPVYMSSNDHTVLHLLKFFCRSAGTDDHVSQFMIIYVWVLSVSS